MTNILVKKKFNQKAEPFKMGVYYYLQDKETGFMRVGCLTGYSNSIGVGNIFLFISESGLTWSTEDSVRYEYHVRGIVDNIEFS